MKSFEETIQKQFGVNFHKVCYELDIISNH